MMAGTNELQQALAMARSADARASEAHRVAREARDISIEAKQDAQNAVHGYRSLYQALGQLTTEVARLASAQEHLAARIGRAILDSVRPSAPSIHDVEEVAEKAAEKAVEKTGSHIVIPSDRVRKIVEHDRHAVIVRIVTIVFTALLAWALGRFTK